MWGGVPEERRGHINKTGAGWLLCGWAHSGNSFRHMRGKISRELIDIWGNGAGEMGFGKQAGPHCDF